MLNFRKCHWFISNQTLVFLREKLVVGTFFDCQRLLDRVEVVKKLNDDFNNSVNIFKIFHWKVYGFIHIVNEFFATSALSKSRRQPMKVSTSNPFRVVYYLCSFHFLSVFITYFTHWLNFNTFFEKEIFMLK